MFSTITTYAKSHKTATAILALTLTFFATSAESCDNTSSGQAAENSQQAAAQDDILKNQPLHHHAYSQMRENLQEIEDAEAEGVQSTTFAFNKASVDPQFECPSVGVPIPNTTSASNPLQIEWSDHGPGVIAQMDPNGVYAPTSSSGTFVICVGPNGSAQVQYAEGDVTTVFYPAHWDYTQHKIVQDGASTFHFTTHK